ncbi:MAG: E1-E2 ATPase-domain-containing protein, partial [Olpidium bornovanus]
GFAIFLAVFIIVVVTAVNNWKKDDLAAEADDVRISVRRNGDSTDIPVHEIHVGDVVLLKDGDIIPVDGLVIDSHNGKCDESSATGESDHIKKKPFDAAAEEAADAAVKARRFPVDVTADVVDGPIDFQRSERPKGQSSSTPFLVQSGTKVNEGTITIVALCVGSNSRYGLLLKEVKKEVEDTPMQKALARLAASIGWFGLGIAFAQLVILTIKFIVRGVQNDWRTGFSLSAGPISSSEKAPVSEFVNAIVNIVIQAVTIVVVAVPEGLPMAVTIALIYGTRKMAQRNNFVRQLAACETMGGATTICTDKTGTLTENKMTVVAGFVADRAFDRSSIASLSTGLADPHSALPDFPSTKARTLFRSSVVRNSKAFVTQDENGSLCFRGDKTEGALLGLCCPDLSNVDLKSERVPVEKVFPFSSKKKSM